MEKKEYETLYFLLSKLMETAPCHGGVCVGHMNCGFGENGCYGESCAIEDIQDRIASKM